MKTSWNIEFGNFLIALFYGIKISSLMILPAKSKDKSMYIYTHNKYIFTFWMIQRRVNFYFRDTFVTTFHEGENCLQSHKPIIREPIQSFWA